MKKIFIIFTVLLVMASALWSGGWNNTLIGCRALAIGAAFAGVADDPSAIFYNPAGLVFQDKKLNFSISGIYISPEHSYTMAGGESAVSKLTSSIPQIFFSFKTSEKVTIGFGAYVPYAGGGLDWKENELGFPFKSSIGVISLTPTVAFQINEKISLGFNLNYYRAVLDFNAAFDPYGPMESEESGSALSAGMGIMFKPSQKLGLGFSIRGPATMKLTGTTFISVQVPEIGTVKLNLDSETSFNLPWDMEFGISYRISNSFLLTTSAQYTMWSTLDKVDKTIKGLPETGDLVTEERLDFRNILILRAGAEYVLPGGLSLRVGIGLDKSASPNQTLSFTNIDVDKFTLIGGIGYKVGKTQFDFVYVSAMGKEREKVLSSAGFPLIEKYNLNATILGLGVTFSF